MSSITFGPAVRPCDQCKEKRRAFMDGLLIGADVILLIATVEDLHHGTITKREALAIILVIVLALVLTAYVKGRLHGIRTLADKLSENIRREHEEVEETEETETASDETPASEEIGEKPE